MTMSEQGPPKGLWHGAHQELNPALTLGEFVCNGRAVIYLFLMVYVLSMGSYYSFCKINVRVEWIFRISVSTFRGGLGLCSKWLSPLNVELQLFPVVIFITRKLSYRKHDRAIRFYCAVLISVRSSNKGTNRPFYKHVIYSMDCSGNFWCHALYTVSRIFNIINASNQISWIH